MAIRYQFRTFADIVNAAMDAMQIQASDTVERNRIKRNVDAAYQEILSYRQWPWNREQVNLQTPTFYGTGTVAVTQNSVVITLTDPPSTSKKGFTFSVNGSNVKYTIFAHVAGSATMQLEVPFSEATNGSQRFKIWTDAIVLPSDLEEVLEVRHDRSNKPVMNLGLQEIRRLEATSPKVEGFPIAYTTSDYKDPDAYAAVASLPATSHRSSNGLIKSIRFAATLGASESTALIRPGDQIEVTVNAGSPHQYNARATVSGLSAGAVSNDTITYTGRLPSVEALTADTTITVRKLSSESYDKYREIIIHPAINNYNVNLQVDYIKQVPTLEADTDEPVIPLRDRIVLYYGTLYHAWSRKRNPEEASANRSLFQAKLDRMAGKTEDSPDKPMIVPSKLYLGAKRGRSGMRTRSGGFGDGGFGGGGSSAPSGSANTVAIFDSDGFLQGSPVISLTELGYLDNATSNIQDQIDALVGGGAEVSESLAIADNQATPLTVMTWPLAAQDSIWVKYALSRGSLREVGQILIASDGSSASIAQSYTAVGAPGIVFSVAVSGSDIVLQYTSTNTGSSGRLQLKWSSVDAAL